MKKLLKFGKIETTTERGDLLANLDIRTAAAACGVRLWQIAEELHIADCNFSRKLRKELTAEEKAKIFAIIDRLETEGT